MSALLVLEDGRVYPGEAYGAVGETVGEVVFATGMTGYQETLTDPSYHRQVVVMTAPHIGNTGVNDEDAESSRVWVAGFVVRDPAPRPSSWRSQRPLEDELAAHGVVGISGVDTRAVVRHLRSRGVMRAGVFSGDALAASAPELLDRVRAAAHMAGAELAGEVTTAEPYVVPPSPSPHGVAPAAGAVGAAGAAGAAGSAGPAGAIGTRPLRVVALDLGIKAMTPRLLAERGVEVHVLPAASTAADVLGRDPDGVFFSNGPGDPATADGPVAVLREVLRAGVPFFGICFGNQLLGRALGFGTYKLPFGHRGINQPVLDRATGRVEVTAHNHGFAVDAPVGEPVEAPAGGLGRVEVSHVGLNDGVVEGLRLLDRPAFSVQYHPEAAAGPHDSTHLFDRFVELMRSGRG